MPEGLGLETIEAGAMPAEAETCGNSRRWRLGIRGDPRGLPPGTRIHQRRLRERFGEPAVTFGYKEVRDIVGVVEFVQDRRAGCGHHIGVVGLSMGAAAAILAAAETPAIEAVVADSSYARLDRSVERVTRRFWRPFAWLASHRARLGERVIGVPLAAVAPVEVIARVSPRPFLIIHGGRDRLTDVEDAYALHRACGDPKTLWIIG